MLLSIAGIKKHYICQLDIKTAFLLGKRESPILIQLPKGHPKKRQNDYCWTTLTSVHGLKDAPLLWYKVLDEKLKQYNLEKCLLDNCLYRSTSRQLNFLDLRF